MTVKKLTAVPKTSTVSPPPRYLAVSVKTTEAEQAASLKKKALRLFCCAMIRLYLQDNTANLENGNRLGVL